MQKALRNLLYAVCALACCPCCFPCYFCAFRNRKRRRDRDTNESRELELWWGPRSPTTVHPLPSRKRRLTLPYGSERPRLEPDQIVVSQEQSLLFAKLPLELRRQIWKEVLGGFDIFVSIQAKRLGHCKVLSPELDEVYQGDDDPEGEHKLLPLLFTCRQVYSEAIPFLYSANSFRSSHIDVIPALASSIRLPRFNAITSIFLSWNLPGLFRSTAFSLQHDEAKLWDVNTRLLASMKALQELHILLWAISPRFGPPRGGMTEVLVMLCRVKPKKHYCLTIDEPEAEEIDKQFKDAPFRLNWRKSRDLTGFT